jgi:hypothetical protein
MSGISTCPGLPRLGAFLLEFFRRIRSAWWSRVDTPVRLLSAHPELNLANLNRNLMAPKLHLINLASTPVHHEADNAPLFVSIDDGPLTS